MSTDELATDAGIDKLDRLRFRDFLEKVSGVEYPASEKDLLALLLRMNLATDDGLLNLAGNDRESDLFKVTIWRTHVMA